MPVIAFHEAKVPLGRDGEIQGMAESRALRYAYDFANAQAGALNPMCRTMDEHLEFGPSFRRPLEWKKLEHFVPLA